MDGEKDGRENGEGNMWKDEGMNGGEIEAWVVGGSIDGGRRKRGRNKEMDTKRGGGMDGRREGWKDWWREEWDGMDLLTPLSAKALREVRGSLFALCVLQEAQQKEFSKQTMSKIQNALKVVFRVRNGASGCSGWGNSDNGARAKAGGGFSEILIRYDEGRTSWAWWPGHHREDEGVNVPVVGNSGDPGLGVLRMRATHWGAIQGQGWSSGEGS